MPAAGPAIDALLAPRPWWGSFNFEEGDSRSWRIGPLSLWVTRAPKEWRFVLERSVDPNDDALQVFLEAKPPQANDKARILRFGYRETDGIVTIRPLLPDRPLIVTPLAPFTLPPDEDVRVFISSPLWFEVRLEDKRVLEEPIHRPKDTWFGPSTREGELCYAGRTSVRLEHETLPSRPQRAVSPVKIVNRARTNLMLERVRLPATNLSLFEHRSLLWTESVRFQREGDGESAEIHLGDGPPSEAAGGRIVAGPRHPERKGLFTRTFGGWFASD